MFQEIFIILKACEHILSSNILLCLIVSSFDDCFEEFVEMELLESLEECEDLDEEEDGLILESDKDGSHDGLSSEN